MDRLGERTKGKERIGRIGLASKAEEGTGAARPERMAEQCKAKGRYGRIGDPRDGTGRLGADRQEWTASVPMAMAWHASAGKAWRPVRRSGAARWGMAGAE